MNTALVTGVSRGIGETITSQLLDRRWKVYGISRSKPKHQRGNFQWLECDLADADSITRSLAEITEVSVDLLVSNAGVAFKEPATAATPDSYRKMFTVNVLAPMLLVSVLGDKLNHSTVISVSSVSDRLIEGNLALYCASKAANTRFFEAVAAELPRAKVFTLLPDYVDTQMLRDLEDPDFDWPGSLHADDVARLAIDLAFGTVAIDSGSNIIVINNKLQEDLGSREKLYGFNTDTGTLAKILAAAAPESAPIVQGPRKKPLTPQWK